MHVKGWSAQTKKVMPVGQDTLDWKKIFTAAKTGCIKNYFVEMNLDLMKASVPYLRNLQVCQGSCRQLPSPWNLSVLTSVSFLANGSKCPPPIAPYWVPD